MIAPPPSSTLFPYPTLSRSLAHPPDVLGPVAGPEAEVVAQPVPDVVPVEQVGRLPALDEPPLQRHGDRGLPRRGQRSEEHTSELQSRQYLVCRLLLEKKKNS